MVLNIGWKHLFYSIIYLIFFSFFFLTFVLQGNAGLPGSQGHPGDEGGPVSLNVLLKTMFPLETLMHLL